MSAVHLSVPIIYFIHSDMEIIVQSSAYLEKEYIWNSAADSCPLENMLDRQVSHRQERQE